MIEEPQYLSENKINSFKKNTCIFCNSKFNTVVKEGEKGTISRGGNGYDEEVDILRIKYLIQDLDIFSFNFEFPEKVAKKFEVKEKEMTDYFRQKKENEGRELGERLEHKIEALFHNLQLGDLKFICETGAGQYMAGPDIIEGCYPEKYIYFCPVGLKSHKACWPASFKVPKNKPVSFNLKFEEFLGHLRKNPQFRDYKALFRGFPKQLNWAKSIDLRITAEPYNPADYI